VSLSLISVKVKVENVPKNEPDSNVAFDELGGKLCYLIMRGIMNYIQRGMHPHTYEGEVNFS
jgi:hypothetical protein